MKITATTLVSISAAIALNVILATNSGNVAERVQQTLRNWRSITPEMLREPSNADVVAMLRAQARSARAVEARALLLNIADPPTVEACITDLRREGSYDQGLALKAISVASQPHLILALVDDLNRDEKAQVNRIPAGEEVSRVVPVSVLAAKAIKRIIVNSAEFSPRVKAWANRIPTDSRSPTDMELSRMRVRKWVKQNEPLLRTKRYDLVDAPRD